MKQLTCIRNILTASSLTGLSLLASLASARTVLYEGIDYPAGDIDGSQTGGTGFADEGWTATGINPFAMIAPGLSAPGVSGMGGAIKRPAVAGGTEMHRSITPVSQRTLTADGSTIWFSVLLRTDAYSTDNANLAFIFGTDPITDNATTKPVTLSGGEGIGVSINPFPPSGPAQRLFQEPPAESKFQPISLLSPQPQHMRPQVVAVLLHHRAQPLRVLAQCRQHLRLDP